MEPTRRLLERIRAGLSTVVVSASGEAPDLPTGTVVLRVDARAAGDLGLLDRAAARIEDVCEGRSSRLARVRAAAGTLRDRLLREEPRCGSEVRFVEAANRLAAAARGRAVVCFEGLEHGEEPGAAALARVLVERPGFLKLPLVLVVRGEPRGPLSLVARTLGDGGVVRIETEAATADDGRETDDGAALAADDVASPEIEAEAAAQADAALARLSPDVLRVLRACAVVGCRSEAALVAALLELPIELVMEALQVARDAGLPLRDHADATFTMPAWLAEALSESVLPSLRMRWHERLAELLGGEEEPVRASAPPPPTVPRPAPHVVARHVAPPRDDMRAALHLASAGRAVDALERRLDAVATATRRGDPTRAAELLDTVAKQVTELPAFDRARLEARLALERARAGWLGVGQETSPSLRDALAGAHDARRLLLPFGRPDLLADAASVVAGIAYDLGDRDELTRAEVELGSAARALLASGRRLEAARLLDDQAALLLRRGDVAAARAALEDALAIFEARATEAPDDALAVADLGDTHHLLARVALHEPAADDLAPALEHARAAERAFSRIGYRRDVARVWETMGRLEARRGELTAARDRLAAALSVEDACVDLTGIARTTAALAEVLAVAGDPGEAVDLLASSVELNREKGSPIGLAFDARALERIRSALAARREGTAPEVRERLARATSRLEEATREVEAWGPRLVARSAEPPRARI